MPQTGKHHQNDHTFRGARETDVSLQRWGHNWRPPSTSQHYYNGYILMRSLNFGPQDTPISRKILEKSARGFAWSAEASADVDAAMFSKFLLRFLAISPISGVSRRHWDEFWPLFLKPLVYHVYMILRGLRGCPHLRPPMTQKLRRILVWMDAATENDGRRISGEFFVRSK